MKVIDPYYRILSPISAREILNDLERWGRVCYKSEEKITPDSAPRFLKSIIKSGHHSVIEHKSISVKFVCDRGITHEIVRHRLASYSQESTRYCNYTWDGFGKEITVIRPFFFLENTRKFQAWLHAMKTCEEQYFKLIELGAKPQEARGVLPNALKTEIVVTANLREWRHILTLRTSAKAHPQIRQIMEPLLNELKQKIPVIFDDIPFSIDQEE